MVVTGHADGGEVANAAPPVDIDAADHAGMRDACGRERGLVTRTRQRYADVQQPDRRRVAGGDLSGSLALRQAAATVRPAIPKPRHIVRWIMTEDGRLTDEQRQQLHLVLATCPHLTALADHVRNFAH